MAVETDKPKQSDEDIMANPLSYPPYRSKFLQISAKLKEGDVVPDGIELSIIGKKDLSVVEFRFLRRDRTPIGTVILPGKSACIAHTNIIEIACLTILNRKPEEDDALYSIYPEQLKTIHISPIYAPTNQHPLHVRLVPNEYTPEGDLLLSYRENLVNLLRQKRVG